jgi:hypothetical protein
VSEPPLPPNHADRLWWCWVRGRDEEKLLCQGKTFYYARNKAAVYFKVSPHLIDRELLPPPDKPTEKSDDHDPWASLGPKPKRSKSGSGNSQTGPKRDEPKRAKKRGVASKKGRKKKGRTDGSP